MTTASTSDISELASDFSSAADSQTSQIKALMAAMMDQRLTANNNKARRNNARKEGNRRGKRSKKTKSYCWTHGVTTNMEHNSVTCDNEHTDHLSEGVRSEERRVGGGQGRGLGGVFRGDSVEVGRESGGPGCFCRVAPVFLDLVHEEGEFRP